jgi:hypothetical protein
MTTEPCFDVAHLGHVELLTNKPQLSLDFFVNVFGHTESGRELANPANETTRISDPSLPGRWFGHGDGWDVHHLAPHRLFTCGSRDHDRNRARRASSDVGARHLPSDLRLPICQSIKPNSAASVTIAVRAASLGNGW